MITKDQIKNLSKTFQIDEFSIFREYLQLVFLSYLYQEKYANKIFFKGGTALRLLFGSPRFSEGLDFSTSYSDLEITKFMKKIEKKLNRELQGLTINPLHKGEDGIRFRIIFKNAEFKYPFSIRLDFHRQKSIMNTQISTFINTQISTLTTQFPIIIFPQISHLSGEGILIEKFEALETRKKGRDIFDIWFLLSKGIKTNKYVKSKDFENKTIKSLKVFPETTLKKDLGRFLPRVQRQIIPSLKKETMRLLLQG
ncbi:MAG: nucleotidyl transferase AbiEii/AbiGii toxin family protein [Patescibacteria group bacterium]